MGLKGSIAEAKAVTCWYYTRDTWLNPLPERVSKTCLSCEAFSPRWSTLRILHRPASLTGQWTHVCHGPDRPEAGLLPVILRSSKTDSGGRPGQGLERHTVPQFAVNSVVSSAITISARTCERVLA